MEQNITVIMTSFVKILQDIGTGDEASYIQILNSASLLIIDDLGAERNTDYALEKAVGWGAKVILSVPCCQHELNEQMESEKLHLMTRYGIIKERFSALTTDAIRANLLECCGYKTQLLEFIDFEHTPKNILIRAVHRPVLPSSAKKKYLAEVENMCREFHLEPTLYTLLRNDCKV